MKIASFDIGRLHMACVWMENDQVLGTRLDRVDGTPASTLVYLDSILDSTFDLVLIERQMSLNSKCLCLQHQIHMYCVMRGLDAVIVSSKLKTPVGLTYAQRKKYTVAVAEKAQLPFPPDQKRDDVADAYCQLMAYLKISK
jgi:hypothetical protein